MANFVYNSAAKEIMDGTIDLLNDTVKIMLVTTGYTANKDHDFVDEGGANDPVDHELSANNYTGGYGGAGRKTLASKAIAVDDANDRAKFDCANITWTSLGGNSADDDVYYAIVIIEQGSDDTQTRLVAFIDTVSGSPSLPFTTTGDDFTLEINAEGLIHLTT